MPALAGMTNDVVANKVKSTSGNILTITYKDGERKITVAPDTSIVRFEPANWPNCSPTPR